MQSCKNDLQFADITMRRQIVRSFRDEKTIGYKMNLQLCRPDPIFHNQWVSSKYAIEFRFKEKVVKNLLVNEAQNLAVIVEGTSLHLELTVRDPTGLRQRMQNLIEKLQNSPTVHNSDADSLKETIECLDAAREELATLSDDRLVKVVKKCVGNTMSPEIKKFIRDKRGKALTTIIQASLD